MWLKIFSVAALALQVILQFVQFLSRKQQRDENRREMNFENQKIIQGMVDEADIIRAGKLADDLLLAPKQRGVGRVPGISANLRGNAGNAGVEPIGSGAKDQGAQSDLGKELPGFTFQLPKRKIEKVFIHCSASDRAEDDNVKTINEWHLARGFSGIGYNYYIDKQGRIWTGRDIERIPAAQSGHNTGSIAICCGGKSFFSAAQFLSLENMCRVISQAYKGKITFHGHCEVSSKTCPNFDYRNVLGLDEIGYISN